MNNKYGHIVYSRRLSGRTIDGNPEVSSTGAGGHGIWVMSEDIPQAQRDAGFQNMALRSVCKHDGYSYYVPSVGASMLAAIHWRTKQERDAADAAGVDSRPASISEWLVGQPVRYPFEYFDSPFWTQIKRPMADLYEDAQPLPLEKPIDAGSVPPGPTDRDEIMQFAADGRIAAIKAAAWALMKQFDLPAGQRKFIVIRDTEPNVRKWIAAIGYSFPRAAACEISFATVMTGLDEADVGCHYPVMKDTGLYVKEINLQDPRQERRCVAMIVGVDPGDESCAKTAAPMPGAPYLVIDGTKKQAMFETDGMMQRAFLQSVVENDVAVCSFGSFMDEMKDVRMGSGLCDLYDALSLLDPDKEQGWTCDSVLKALSVLRPHFTRESVLLRFMLDRLCVQLVYQTRFADEDGRNNFALFALLYDAAREFGNQAALEALEKLAIVRLNALLFDGAAEPLTAFTQRIKEIDGTLYAHALKAVVGDGKLGASLAVKRRAIDVAFVAAVIDLIDDCFALDRLDWEVFFTDPGYADAREALTKLVCREKALVCKLLERIADHREALDLFIVMGRKAAMDTYWWRLLLECRLPVEHLCRLISERLDLCEIEEVLCIEMHIHGYADSLRELFNRYLARVPGAGEKFYRMLIRSVSGLEDEIRLLRRALTDLSVNGNFSRLLREILLEMDRSVMFEHNRRMAEYTALITEFAARARVYCDRAMLWNYLAAMSFAKISRRDRDGIAGVYLSANPGARSFDAPDDLLESAMGKAFVKCMQAHVDEPAAHVIAVMSLSFDDAQADQRYLSGYAQAVCADAVKRKSGALASVIHLHRCVADDVQLGEPCDRLLRLLKPQLVERRLDALLNAARGCLCELRTDGAAERLTESAEKDFGKPTAQALAQLLAETQEIYRESHKGGIFGRIIGLVKKK